MNALKFAAVLLVMISILLVSDAAEQTPNAQPESAEAALSPDEGLPRQVVFISDLHLGLGKNEDGSWHPTEDFRWHADFQMFLTWVLTKIKGPIDLVVLGDFLELWQSDLDDCLGDGNKNYGCTQEEAFARLDRVVTAHSALFEQLSSFLRSKRGQHTLTIVPGNHDVALLLPGGEERLVQAFDEDVRNQVKVPRTALWVSDDQSVLAEHGQQIGKDPNKFSQWPDTPWYEADGKRYLAQSWGEAFVQALFNRLETRFPAIDNFSGRLEALKYVKASLTAKEELNQLADVFRFLLFQQSWRQFGGVLGEDGLPEWDLEATRARMDTSETRWESLLYAIPDEAVRELLLGAAPDVAPFTDEEIRTVCNASRMVGVCGGPDSSRCHCEVRSDGTLAGAGETVAKVINRGLEAKIFKEYFNTEFESRAPGWTKLGYVYGHTHDPKARFYPYKDSPAVLNDGAWQRTISINDLKALQGAQGWADDELLVKLQPEHLPACYPFVRLLPPVHDKGRQASDLRLFFFNVRSQNSTYCVDTMCRMDFLSSTEKRC